MPVPWQELFKMLCAANTKKKLLIDNPLILAGWGASDESKYYRFVDHLKVANELEILPSVAKFLDSLEPKDFLVSKRPLETKGYWDLIAEDIEEVKETKK